MVLVEMPVDAICGLLVMNLHGELGENSKRARRWNCAMMRHVTAFGGI